MSELAKQAKALARHNRQVITYGWLWHASSVTFDLGRTGVRGSAWQWMASAILTAFALEAYANHVGASLLGDWEERERKLSVRRKLDLIAMQVGVDLGGEAERPLSTIAELVEFRNTLAHGRSATLSTEDVLVDLDDVDRHLSEDAPLTDWEAKIRSEEFAARVRTDVEAVLQLIHGRLPDQSPLFFRGVHSSSAQIVHQQSN